MSKKIKQQIKTPSKQENKISKSTSSSKVDNSSSPKTQKEQVKSQIVSNTEEGSIAIFLWVILFVVVGIGVYATKPLWAPHVLNYLPPHKITTGDPPPRDLLTDRINQLEKEIKLVRESGQAIGDLEIERGRLNKNFEGVMARIISLEKQIDNVRKMKRATMPQTDAFVTNESLNRLNSRLMDLEGSDERATAVLERLNKLEEMVAERETKVGSSSKGLLQTMTDISRRILTLENSSAQSAVEEISMAETRQQVRAQNLVLAVGYLRESLRSSDSFTKSLEALRALGGDDPDIISGLEELEPFAKTGIHTMDMLRRQYDTVAENIRLAASGDTSRKITRNTLSEVFNQVTSLVTVRKTGTETFEDIKTNPVDTARVQLDQGDLEGAIATLSDLRGKEAAIAAPWLADAKGRLIAEKTLSRLHVFVVSILATSIQ